MKYKVGDKVKVRKDLINHIKYGANSFVCDMEDAKGKKLEIISILGLNYHLKGFGPWGFTDEMFEPTKESHKPQFTTDKQRGFKSIYIDGITIAIPIETIVGIAYKNPADEYNEERGKSLAYYRMEGQE